MGLLRKVMIETRNRLEGRPERSERIAARLFDYLPESVDRVFIYVSVGSEVETGPVIARLLAEGRQVFCPKVIDRDIVFFEIFSPDDLKPGYQGIPEPFSGAEGDELLRLVAERSVDPDPNGGDIVIMPGVTFDSEGNRMGYGAGMYDRFLLKHDAFKIALAFECQVYFKTLDEQDEFDVPVDMLITEEKIRDFTTER